MTVLFWNMIFNAVVSVAAVIYGVWLKLVVDQQLKTKDTAIQALEAALKSKDAEIERLQGDTAPSIAAAYAAMRQHADRMTADTMKLAEQVKNKPNPSAERKAGEIVGLRTAMEIIGSELQRTIPSPTGGVTSRRFLDAFNAATRQLSERANVLVTEYQNLKKAEALN